MDQSQRTLTRPATPRAIHLSNGRYSFVAVPKEDRAESVEIPDHLREERTTSK